MAKKKITDRIKTFEDAMVATGETQIPSFSDIPGSQRTYHIALYKMIIIVKALNEGWIPDWDNFSECKWRPWFVMSPSGFAFRASHCAHELSDAGSGSRLCLKSAALSDYCGTQFLDLWKEIQ